MSSLRRIVVAVDSSRNARVALEHAIRRAGREGQLIVAHVMRSIPDTVAKAMVIGDEYRNIAHQLVNQLVGAYAKGAEPVVLEGSPAERLAQLARERDAAEIVVGSRGLGRFSAALGSVSHALLQQADRPVVVVPAAAADHPQGQQRAGDPRGIGQSMDAALAVSARAWTRPSRYRPVVPPVSPCALGRSLAAAGKDAVREWPSRAMTERGRRQPVISGRSKRARTCWRDH